MNDEKVKKATLKKSEINKLTSEIYNLSFELKALSFAIKDQPFELETIKKSFRDIELKISKNKREYYNLLQDSYKNAEYV